MKTTSLAVTSLPSDHFTPGRSCHVIDIRSWEIPPLSRVGISDANLGVSFPSGSWLARGSSVIAPASRSLYPSARYGPGREGACQYRMVRVFSSSEFTAVGWG